MLLMQPTYSASSNFQRVEKILGLGAFLCVALLMIFIETSFGPFCIFRKPGIV